MIMILQHITTHEGCDLNAAAIEQTECLIQRWTQRQELNGWSTSPWNKQLKLISQFYYQHFITIVLSLAT